MKTIEYIKPVDGAARYFVIPDPNSTKFDVMMEDVEGYIAYMESASTREIAIKKANSWQKKENKAVLKNLNKI